MRLTGDMLMMEAYDCAVDLYRLRLDTLLKMENLDSRTHALSELSGNIPLEYYTEDAGSSQAAEKKKGIIRRLWDAIINLFTSIKNAIFKSAANQIDPNAEGDVPSTWLETSKIATLGNKLKQMKKGDILKAGIAIIGAIGAVIALFKVANDAAEKRQTKMNHISGKDAQKLAQIYGTNADVICKAARQIEDFDLALAVNAADASAREQKIFDKMGAISAKQEETKDRKEKKQLGKDLQEQNDVWKNFRQNLPPEIKQYMNIIGAEIDKAGTTIPKDESGILAMIRTGLANVGKLLREAVQNLLQKFKKK